LLAFKPFSPSTKIHLPPAIIVSKPIPSTSSITVPSKLPGCNHILFTPTLLASFKALNVIAGGVKKLRLVASGVFRSATLLTTERDSIVEAVGLIG